MRVVALFRVSTERQANEGASLESQERRYHELVKREGWTSIATFRGCESATQAASDRRVLQQVLGCLRDEEPDAIYVHEQSRLTRGDELEVAMLMRELKERGIKIIVNAVVRDLNSIDERFMVGVQSLVDRAESERIKERLTRGKREKARQGKKCGGPAPYGYMNPPPGSAGRGTLQVVPEEAAVVRRIFEMAVSGKSERAIVRHLNETRVPGPRGEKWGKTSLRRVLSNPTYTGVSMAGVWVRTRPGGRSFRMDMTNPKAIVVPGAHEAIVDHSTFAAASNRLRPVSKRHPRMLTGLLHVNGQPYSGNTDGPRKLYSAPRGVRYQPWLEVKVVDDAVWSAFLTLATSPELVERLMAEGRNPKQAELARLEIEHMEDQLAKATRRADRLVEMRADGEITKENFAAKSAETRKTIEQLESGIAKQRTILAALDVRCADQIVRAVQMLVGGRTKLTDDQKAGILRSIVRRVDATAERVHRPFKRDERGRVVGSGGAHWALRRIEFQLALPSPTLPHVAAGEAGTPVGVTASLPATAPAVPEASRPCQPVPASERLDLLAAVVPSRVPGHMVTTERDSDHDAGTENGADSCDVVQDESGCASPPRRP